MIAPVGHEMLLVRGAGEVEAWWAQLMHQLWERSPGNVAAILDPPTNGSPRGTEPGPIDLIYERLDARLLSLSPDPLAAGALTSGARRLLLSARFHLESEFAVGLGRYAVGLAAEEPIEPVGRGAEVHWLQLRVGTEVGPSRDWLTSERASGSATVEVAIERANDGRRGRAITTSICGLNPLSLHRSRCAVAARALSLFSRVLFSDEGGDWHD